MDAQQTSRRRLPPDGLQILREAYAAGTTYPQKPERVALLKKIHDLGYTWYTDGLLSNWFISRRKSLKDREEREKGKSTPEKLKITIPGRSTGLLSANSIDSATPNSTTTPKRGRPKSKRLRQYPSIEESVVKNLAVLVGSSRDISMPNLVETWATLIKADPEDVRRWAEMYHRTGGNLGLDQSDSEEEPLSNAMGRSQSAKTDSPHNKSLATTAAPTPVSSSAQPIPSLPPRDQLLLSIHKGVSSMSDESELPKTSSDLNNLFAPYETMMEQLIKDVETGKLQNMGWNS